jgi:hexosaminidase
MMTKINRRQLIFMSFIICQLSFSPAKAQNYDVVPLPQSIEMQKGEPFVLNGEVQILAAEGLQQEAEFLQQYISEVTGIQLQLAQKKEKKQKYIELAVNPKVSQQEGYVLTVTAKGITIQGGSAAGVFYGIQTMRKSLPLACKCGKHGAKPGEAVNMPATIITDAPRFGYRGMMLDCSRHFWSVDFVKKFIDLLALHSMNRFHWHLTDDQGWRIEIKKYPKLTEIGSQRSGTVLGTNSDLDDGIPHGGFYTQQEAREIVKYAQDRHITVIPEIDMPGHMVAALACYPELGCTGGPYEVGHYWGVYTDVLCVGNPKVYEFVEGVLTEIMDIFPSEVIHIGGDETPTVKWEVCPKCQALGLAKDKLQAHFTQKVFDFLTAHQRRALGWDEILDGCPKDAMIMSWRGSEPGAKAAELGHDVIMTPTSHVYFDYLQSKEAQFEPSRCGGFIPVEKVYSLEPAPDTLSAEAKTHILGTQANLWTEYIFTEGLLEYQALPRMSALAEVQWTQPDRKDYEAFKERLTRMTSLFKRYNYQYAKHLWPERQLPSRWQF